MTIITSGKMTVTISQGDFVSIECSCGDSKFISWDEFPENEEALEWILNFALSVAQSVSFGKKSTTRCPSNSSPCYLKCLSTKEFRCRILAVA
jgi:hypothetical protein